MFITVRIKKLNNH